MPIQIITPPTVEPVTLQEAKDHLRVDFNEDDSLIDGLIIPSARQSAENYLRRALMTQTLELSFNNFISGECIGLPFPPLQSVESIKYIDTDGIEQTLAATEYDVFIQNEPGIVVEAYEKAWPDTRAVMNAVKIRYIAGYANEADVPRPIKSAILLLVGHLYENREENMVVQGIEQLPMGYRSLLSPYRLFSF